MADSRIVLSVMTDSNARSEIDADQLVVRAKTDRDAFGQLYDLIYPAIFRYCVRRVGQRSRAEDLTSIVFLSVAKTIADLPAETYQGFRRWVFTIATHEIHADFRKTARRQTLLVRAVESGLIGESAEAIAFHPGADYANLQQAIGRLSEQAQAIITLRFFSALPYQDIAQILDISAGAARTAAHRALECIRLELQGVQ